MPNIQISRIMRDDIDAIYRFIRKFPLDYPNYSEWLEKCRQELKAGIKTGFYAQNNGNIVGSIIFQAHKEKSSVIEIKNFRVAEEYRGKGIGTKLYRTTEEYARARKFLMIEVDTHNKETIGFFKRNGFKIRGKKPLYKKDRLEIILEKEV